jgi:tetratricopeptide (TPR) repeat protein
MAKSTKNSSNFLSEIKWLMSAERKHIVLGSLIVVVVLLLVVLVMSSEPGNDTNQEQMSGGNQVLQAYREKIPELEAKLESDGDNVETRRELATALYATGDIESAKDHYLQELSNNPDDYVLHNNLANVYRDLGQYQEAVDNYQKSINLQPKQMNAYLNLANVYVYQLDQLTKGIGIYDQAVENYPKKSEDFLIQKGNSYKNNGMIEKAKEVYKKVLEINPNNSIAQNLLNQI